jgi:hypothetical protein
LTDIPALDVSLKPRMENLPAFIEAMNQVGDSTKTPVIKLHNSFLNRYTRNKINNLLA